jgi:hypothetical protein
MSSVPAHALELLEHALPHVGERHAVLETAEYVIQHSNLKTCFEMNQVMMIPIARRLAAKAKRLGQGGVRMLALRPEGSAIGKIIGVMQGSKGEEGVGVEVRCMGCG